MYDVSLVGSKGETLLYSDKKKFTVIAFSTTFINGAKKF